MSNELQTETTNETREMTLEEATRAKFESWGLHTKPLEEQVAEINRFLIPGLAFEISKGQRFEEVIVPEELFQATVEAFQNPLLPSSEDPEEQQMLEQTAPLMKAAIAQIMVKHGPLEQFFARVDYMQAPPEMHFFRFATVGTRYQQWLRKWFHDHGFFEVLQEDMCPFDFSFNELKIIYGIARSLEGLARHEAQRIQLATDKDMKFGLDLRG